MVVTDWLLTATFWPTASRCRLLCVEERAATGSLNVRMSAVTNILDSSSTLESSQRSESTWYLNDH